MLGLDASLTPGAAFFCTLNELVSAVGVLAPARGRRFPLAGSLAKEVVASKQVAMVGDQLFTDVLGGNRLGAMTILVDDPLWTRWGRRWAHLVSDSDFDELQTFARWLGLPVDGGRQFKLDTATISVLGYDRESLGGWDVKTGERVWENLSAVPKARWSTIHFIKNHDKVWMFTERGELLITKLSPQGFEEISRTKIIAPTTEQLNQRGG